MALRNSAIPAGSSTPDSSTKPSRCIASSRWAVRVVSCMALPRNVGFPCDAGQWKTLRGVSLQGAHAGAWAPSGAVWFDRSYAPAWERLCRRSASGRVGTITSPSTSGSAHDLQTTLPIALALHLDLHRDAFMHFRHVADHRYLASLGLQRVQRVHGDLQRLGVEAAEAFVDE